MSYGTTMVSRNVQNVMDKVKLAIDVKTRRGWYDLQKTSWWKNSQQAGIRTVDDLRKALVHFNVLLSDRELERLFRAFPLPNPDYAFAERTRTIPSSVGVSPGFDFKAFAAALYPRPGQEPEIMEPEDDYSARPVSQYSQPMFDKTYDLEGSWMQGYKQQNMPPVVMNSGERIITDAEMPRLGGTAFSTGTTTYWQPLPETGPMDNGASQRIVQQRPRRVLSADTQRRSLQHNRHAHQRQPFRQGQGPPRPASQQYPAQELRTANRFSSRPIPLFQPSVEVSRRNNISRSGSRRLR